MASKAKTRSSPPPEPVIYQGPQQTLEPCPRCGQLVLARRWQMDAKQFVEENPQVSPLLGMLHTCTTGEHSFPPSSFLGAPARPLPSG